MPEHKNKTSKSAKYIRYFDSLKREYQLKQWTKAKKEALIAGNTSAEIKESYGFWFDFCTPGQLVLII